MKKKWSQKPHETWQVDGKSDIELGNGQKVSWMNIADEGSGSHLKAFVVDKRIVEEMLPSSTTQKMNESFLRWGLPQNIKIDNGRPFINPNAMDIPTMALYWWIGLGINVIQNKPGCPQQNGIVEGLQGTLYRWSNPKEQPDQKAFQRRVDEESEFQRNHYKIPSRNHKTRRELYPDLENNIRRYCPSKFDMQLVYAYLESRVFRRTVKNNGVIKIFGETFYMGRKYLGIEVTITFDPIDKQWIFKNERGVLMSKSSKGVPIEDEIKAFALSDNSGKRKVTT